MTLFEKIRDAKIRLRLWFFLWMGAVTASTTAVFFYLRPADAPMAWGQFQTLKLLDSVGLGGIAAHEFLGISRSLLEMVQADPAAFEAWHRDFSILVQTPVIATISLAIVFLVSIKKGDSK